MAAFAAATSAHDAASRPASRASTAAVVAASSSMLPAVPPRVRCAPRGRGCVRKHHTRQHRRVLQPDEAVLRLLHCGIHQTRQPLVHLQLAGKAQRILHLLRPARHELAKRKRPAPRVEKDASVLKQTAARQAAPTHEGAWLPTAEARNTAVSELWNWYPLTAGLHLSSTARSASAPSTSLNGDGRASTVVAKAGSVTMSITVD